MERLKLDSQIDSMHFEPVVDGSYIFAYLEVRKINFAEFSHLIWIIQSLSGKLWGPILLS